MLKFEYPGFVMSSRILRPLTVASCLVVFASTAPAFAADYGGCGLSCSGSVGYDYGPSGDDDRLIVDPDSPYFISDNDQTAANPNENFSLRGSIGIAHITANEHVYAFGSGTQNLSLLVWDTYTPIANADVKVRLPGAWTVQGHVEAALPGKSTMTDYDWTGFSPSYNMNDWDHRSISPNTNLDWYLKGDIALGRDFPINEALTVNVNGGVGYTDVQWTAVGGTYIYSVGGFRDTSGTIPDVPGVRYRQQLPVGFVGVDAAVNDGAWSLDAGARAGLVLYGISTDHHYLRVPPMVIVDQLNLGQELSAKARLGYAFNDHLSAFVEGSYTKMLAAHTATDYYNMNTGALMIHGTNFGGAELDAATLSAGLKGNF